MKEIQKGRKKEMNLVQEQTRFPQDPGVAGELIRFSATLEREFSFSVAIKEINERNMLWAWTGNKSLWIQKLPLDKNGNQKM